MATTIDGAGGYTATSLDDESETIDLFGGSGDTSTQTSDDYKVRDAVGSTSGITTTLDPDTGDATQTIGDPYGTATVPDASTTGITVDTGNGGNRTLAQQEQVEQYIETESGGAAFGSDTVDDIGSGEAVENTTPDGGGGGSAAERAQAVEDRLPIGLLSVGVAAAGLAYTVVSD